LRKSNFAKQNDSHLVCDWWPLAPPMANSLMAWQKALHEYWEWLFMELLGDFTNNVILKTYFVLNITSCYALKPN
jgi:hypothetical protein